MTDDRYHEQRPATRRMEPIDPSAGSSGYRGDAGTGAPGPDTYSSAPPYPDEGGYTAYTEPQRASTDTGRTVLLSLIALLALALLVLAGFLVYRSVNGTEGAAPVAPGVSTSSTSAPTSVPSSATTTTTTTTTTPVGTPTTVSYHFTGTGSLIAVNYTSTTGSTVVATAGAPWQVQASVGTGETAQITGIVVSGQVTCQIRQGGTVLAESTGNVGPITCSATVPTGG